MSELKCQKYIKIYDFLSLFFESFILWTSLNKEMKIAI